MWTKLKTFFANLFKRPKKEDLQKYVILYVLTLSTSNKNKKRKFFRPILVSYISKDYKNTTWYYRDTKLIEIAPYFKKVKPKTNHYFIFLDNGYGVESKKYTFSVDKSTVKPYIIPYHYKELPSIPKPIEFECSSDQEAIIKFNEVLKIK
jgi:hypothetical protein